MTRSELVRMLDPEPSSDPVYALPGQPCTCGSVGYCPQHGTYEPPQMEDGEYVTWVRTRIRGRNSRSGLSVRMEEATI